MKTPRTSLRLLVGLALATTPLALAGACGKKDGPPPEAPPTTSAPTTPQDEGAPRRDLEPGVVAKPEAKPAGALSVPALAGPFATAGLYAVPKGAPFVLVGSPQKLFDALGYAGLFEKYGMLLGGFGEKMAEVSGKDFFKLASWGEIGIDLASPMGVFMPELETQAIVTFVPLSDASKLIAFVTETAKKVEAPVTAEKIGEATLLTLGDRDRNAWLVNGQMFYAVTLMRGNGAAAIAKEILGRKEADSIVSLPELKSTLEGLDADEMGVFVQLKTILEKTMIARAESRMAPLPDPYASELDAAKKAGDAAEIARLEQASASEKELMERMSKRRAAELDFVKSIVGELSVLAAGLDVGDTFAEATVKLPLAEGGMLKGLMRNAGDMQSILKATKNEPLMVSSGQVDPQAFLALIEKAMAADGESLAEVREQLSKGLGIDLDKDVVAAFSGELGFALTGDIATLMKSKDPTRELGGAIVIGLKPDTGMKAIVAKLAAQEGAGNFVKWDEAAGVLTVTLPEQRPIQVAFSDNRLIASTDLDTASRLAGNETFVAAIANPKLKALLERKDLAALFTMSPSFMGGWMLASGQRSSYLPPMPENASAEVRGKFEAVAKLEAEIQPLRAASEEAQMKPVLAALEKLGMFAAGVTLDAQGVHATFGLYTKGATVPEVVAALVDMGMQVGNGGGEPSEGDKRLRELEDQRWKLESELWDTNRPKAVEEIMPEPKVAPEPK